MGLAFVAWAARLVFSLEGRLGVFCGGGACCQAKQRDPRQRRKANDKLNKKVGVTRQDRTTVRLSTQPGKGRDRS